MVCGNPSSKWYDCLNQKRLILEEDLCLGNRSFKAVAYRSSSKTDEDAKLDAVNCILTPRISNRQITYGTNPECGNRYLKKIFKQQIRNKVVLC
jgi:hypothetical protein